MDNNTSNSVENNSKPKHKWIFTILSIPEIGGLITTIITLAPASIFSLIFILISPSEESALPGAPLIFITAILLSSMLLTTWWWLNYLEGKLNLAILLPIPFLKIRLKWVLYPFMLPFFGLRRIYRHFTTKRPMDNVNSLHS